MEKTLNIKYQPERTCVACRKKGKKTDFIRVVKTPTGEFIIDKTGKAEGRGAYICCNKDCIAKLKKTRQLNRAFKCEVQNSVYDAVEEAFVDKQEQN
ncbi:MAG: YlxR family protein [Clostridia bacterium]|nr:YlxR family protein [Clostridia bacterium]